MKYKYQLHAHTANCSGCSVMSPKDLIDALHDGGYQGMVITNHFFGGNTCIPRSLPWKDFVYQYELDYNECVEYAKKYDMDIIFGIEEHIGEGLEILPYGITPEVLYNHEELLKADLTTWKKVALGNDFLIIQAHPFRDRTYIPHPRVLPRSLIDGIEVFNHCNLDDANKKAKDFADKNSDLIFTSGADTHSVNTASFAGIETCERIKNEKQLFDILVAGKYKILCD